jgi:AraC family transcriptional regulator
MADLSGLPRLWQRFGPYIGHVPGAHGHDSYGVCYNPDDQGGFDYLAGVEVDVTAGLPAGFTHLELSPQHYAVFEHHGSLQALKATFDGIFQQWLPASGERSANAAVFERYPAGFDPADHRPSWKSGFRSSAAEATGNSPRRCRSARSRSTKGERNINAVAPTSGGNIDEQRSRT